MIDGHLGIAARQRVLHGSIERFSSLGCPLTGVQCHGLLLSFED